MEGAECLINVIFICGLQIISILTGKQQEQRILNLILQLGHKQCLDTKFKYTSTIEMEIIFFKKKNLSKSDFQSSLMFHSRQCCSNYVQEAKRSRKRVNTTKVQINTSN